MDKVLSVFILGLSYGLVLFLVATGLSMTMGLMRIVNMAHGALFMVGGFVGLTVAQHSNFVCGVIAALAITAAAGFLLEVGFLRRLYKQEASQVLLTIGFIYILSNIAQWIWSAFPKSGAVPDILSKSITIGAVDVPSYRLFLIGFGLVMAVLLWLFQDKTKVGARVRAGMDSRETAGSLGINLKLLFTGIFCLGSLLAGLAGFMGGKVVGVNLGLAWDGLLLSLIVVVIGGAGSIQGTLIGGVILGLLNSYGAAYFPSFASYLMYAALILILLVRPAGLLGRKFSQDSADALERASALGGKPAKKSRAAGVAAKAVIVESSTQKRLKKFLPLAVVLVLLVAVPPFVGVFTQNMITKVLIYAAFAMSLDLIMGYTGLLSFGHAALFGMGGYAFGLLTLKAGITNFWPAFAITVVVCILMAAAIGFVSLRVSGVYFLLVTMAFGQLLYAIASKWYSFTGGKDGLPGIKKPDLGWAIHWTALKFYFFVLIVLVICCFILYKIVHSSFGSTLIGIRENEPRMRSMGYNTWAIKYAAVILAGTFAGVAGALFSQFYGTMVPNHFALEMSALPMLMVIIGGGGTLWGPALGAVAIVLVEHYSSVYLTQRWPLILGGLFVVCVMFMQGGFARYLSSLWAKVRFGGSKTEPEEVAVKGVEL
jgi:branched-chain amino acid transport system permease protein